MANHDDETIQSFAIDQSSGALASQGTIPGSPGMVALAAHPNGRHVYALASVPATPSRVLSYDIDLADGMLTNSGAQMLRRARSVESRSSPAASTCTVAISS